MEPASSASAARRTGRPRALDIIRVLLVDDHELVRQGLRRMLAVSSRIAIVGEAADGVEAVRQVSKLSPDVVVMDVSMPRKDGIETTGEIMALGLDCKVLILTMHCDSHYALRTMQAGATGFLWKGVNFKELLAAITAVAEGERYLPEDLREDLEAMRTSSTAQVLTRREFQVLPYLASGMTNHEIARELGISVKTIDTHRGSILKKLDLKNNSELTRFAIRKGLLRP